MSGYLWIINCMIMQVLEWFMWWETPCQARISVTMGRWIRFKNSKSAGKNMGVSKNRGTPKWMVYDGKPYYIKWIIWVVFPLFLEKPICNLLTGYCWTGGAPQDSTRSESLPISRFDQSSEGYEVSILPQRKMVCLGCPYALYWYTYIYTQYIYIIYDRNMSL